MSDSKPTLRKPLFQAGRGHSASWLVALAIIPLALGLLRLHLDVEVLNLLPANEPTVEGLKIYQQHFANARELIVTIQTTNSEAATETARAMAERLRQQTNLVSSVVWQAPWLEHPEQTAELLAYLWLNQPPEAFGELTSRLRPANLPELLSSARERLATSMSPNEIAQNSYDPFGLTRLPSTIGSAPPGFGPGQDFFASPEGTFRMLFVQARTELSTYRECAQWLERVKTVVSSTLVSNNMGSTSVVLGFTGRPAFVAEISAAMERDITGSVIGTALIIAVLFWLAHRRWKPMLWLLALLILILFSTLALGGLIFGNINVMSMGFAAILLGLAVDYAVVHYQEAIAHRDLSIPQVRRAIAPSIFWAATTTISAFLVLNFGGLPGLAQLGSLVALGVALSAIVMIFAYLPPLFPERMTLSQAPIAPAASSESPHAPTRAHQLLVWIVSIILLGSGLVLLSMGRPAMDSTANALRPRKSEAYATLEQIKTALGQNQEPLWIITAGSNVAQVAQRLDRLGPLLAQAQSNGILTSVATPTMLWPRADNQAANHGNANALVSRRSELRAAAEAAGFSETAFGFTASILETWERAAAITGVFWPTNDMSRWVIEKLTARDASGFYALSLIYPANTNVTIDPALSNLATQVHAKGVWLSGWPLLGAAIFQNVRANLWKIVLPMLALILASLWFAFRRPIEVLLSIATLCISGLGLLSVMQLSGWSWNLMNLMALPLVLGTGVDYSIFMQLALRRHEGALQIAHKSVGRALLLCGGTAIAGFGSLAFSSNRGMASLGQVCATGIAFNVFISVFLLPLWWRRLVRRK